MGAFSGDCDDSSAISSFAARPTLKIMAPSRHYTRPDRSHLGSTTDDILNEPEWAKTHNNRIGFRDRNDRFPGFTHHGDEWHTEQEQEFLAQAKKEAEELGSRLVKHDLTHVREFMTKQEVCASTSFPV